jgi:hypothetical protein
MKMEGLCDSNPMPLLGVKGKDDDDDGYLLSWNQNNLAGIKNYHLILGKLQGTILTSLSWTSAQSIFIKIPL